MNNEVTIYPVIMAGGSGTRFWPLSRQLFPKQLLKIIGDETLIQQTMRRVLISARPERVMISTNPAQAESIRVQLSEWKDALKDNFVLEPEGRNTAPAIALTVKYLMEKANAKEDEILFFSPSDHIIEPEKDFARIVKECEKLALNNIVTFGIVPNKPETGYGYIELGQEESKGAYKVSCFVDRYAIHRICETSRHG